MRPMPWMLRIARARLSVRPAHPDVNEAMTGACAQTTDGFPLSNRQERSRHRLDPHARVGEAE
jgi:hypothetical protein